MALLDNIIGCWSPSVRGSGYLLPDLAGGGNHCVLTNMTADDWVPVSLAGASGKALDFDGVNDVAACAKPSQRLLMTPTTPWTVSAWLNPRLAPSGVPCLVGTWHISTNVSGWLIGLRPDGTLGFGALIEAGSSGLYSRTSTALAAKWQHVVVVYYGEVRTANNIVGEVYIDGVAVSIAALAAGSFATCTSPQFSIGGNYDGNGSNSVQIGEVAVFLGNKTPVEARELYRRGNGGIGRVLTGQSRRPVYGAAPSFKAAWALRRSQIIGGGLR